MSGKFSAIITLNISSAVLSFSGILIMHMLHHFKLFGLLLSFLSLFLSLFYFSFGSFHWPFMVTDSFSGCVNSTEEIVQDILHFFHSTFDFESLFLILRVDISLLILPICSWISSGLFMRVHDTLIIVILNFLPTTSKFQHLCLIWLWSSHCGFRLLVWFSFWWACV